MRQILIFLAVTALGFCVDGMPVAMTAQAQASSPDLQNEDGAGPVAPAPPAHDYPIIQFPHDGVNSSGVADCYGYNVSWSSPDWGSDGLTMVSVRDQDGSEVFTYSREFAANTPLSADWCGDVLKNGSLALGYSFYTGGASGCCSISWVVNLETGAYLLDSYDGPTFPLQLGDGGALELQSAITLWPDGISHANARGLPVLLLFDGNTYVESTRSFPDELKQELAKSDAELADLLGTASADPEELRVSAAKSYALALLVGQEQSWTAEWSPRLRQADRAWLLQRESELKKLIADNYR